MQVLFVQPQSVARKRKLMNTQPSGTMVGNGLKILALKGIYIHGHACELMGKLPPGAYKAPQRHRGHEK